MKALTKDDIVAASDLPLTEVPVPEWGGIVYLRPLAGWERDQWDLECGKAEIAGAIAPDEFRARLLAKGLVDETGAAIFNKREDVAVLARKNAAVIARLHKKLCLLSGIGKEAQEQAEKNSAPAPSDSSGSNSPTATPAP